MAKASRPLSTRPDFSEGGLKLQSVQTIVIHGNLILSHLAPS